MPVEIWIKGRFRELPDATVRAVSGNAWQVRVERSDAVAKVIRGDLSKALEGAILVVEGMECEPAVVSQESKAAVTVSVWAL